MGNSKNKKVPKNRRASNKSECRTSSEQKENVPKSGKARAIKPEPNGGIAMSKQLLLKKNNVRTQRRSLSKPERICPNGKPLPSLSELEKMYEDSDDDDDQRPKTPIQKPRFATSTPEKQHMISEKHLLSPATINKITERIMGSIQNQNLPDPTELMEATSLLRETSPPPLPVIPPKKRKKPDVPYIVGCKDRPKVIHKPNANFCKGDDDYGVEASSEDPEDQTPTKRAKKSRIPNYSKSIFNAHSDEIAERLAKDDAGGLSDASSDSNKTIEYYPTLSQNLKPHSFSPLPSTSRDSETFRKNDELFNESLKEINISNESTPKTNEDDLPMIKLSTLEKKDDHFLKTKELTPKQKDDFLTTNLLTPKESDDILITEQPTQEDGVQIIDIPYDTIVIGDVLESNVGKQDSSSTIDTTIIEIIEPQESEIVKAKEETIIHKIPDDEDCMIVPNSETIKNHNNFKVNEPIVIDDEYSTINMEFDSFNNEPIEIIDVDDIIAENKSILEKWKSFGAKQLNKINTVVDVPTTYKNVTMAPQTTVTPSTTVQTTVKPSSMLQACVTPSSTLQASVTPSSTLPTSVTPSSTLQASVTPSSTLPTSVTPSFTMQASVIPNSTLLTSVTPSSLQANVTPSSILQASVTPSTILQTTNSTLQDYDSYFNLYTTNRNKATHSRNKRRPSTSVNNTQKTVTYETILVDYFKSRYKSVQKSPDPRFSQNLAEFMSGMSQHYSGIVSHPANNTNTVSTSNINNTCNRQTFIVADVCNSPTPSGTLGNSTIIPTPSPVPSRNIGDCPICLDPLNSSNGIASTICGHVFCLKCIQASVKTNGKKCPTCRKALKGAGGGYHQLYL